LEKIIVMKLNSIQPISKLFLLTSIAYFLYSPIVHVFFANQQIGHTNLHPSEIFLILGVIRLIISIGYILDDFYNKEFFSGKLRKYHFYLTLPMVFIVILTPILDTYYPTSDANREGYFYSIIGYIIVFAAFGLIFGIGMYVVNIFRGIIKN
jgi:hypothetical protein